MPTIAQDHPNHPHIRSERKSGRAASVPVSRREHPGLDSLRSRRQKPSLNVKCDTPPPNVPARGRKRNLTRDSPQVDGNANLSVTAAEPRADNDVNRPRKRPKRSTSTPAPRPSQLSTQLQPRTRWRSRAGSPDVAAQRFYFINELNSDIYTHLADPGNAGNLLREPSAASIISSTPCETIDSQSTKKSRGRKRKAVDLTDENTKRDLMEEWARMRQSQGTFFSGIDVDTCISRAVLHDTQKDDEPVQPVELGTITSPAPRIMETTQTTHDGDSPSTRAHLEIVLAGTDASGRHEGSVLSADSVVDPWTIPDEDTGVPSTSTPDPHMDKDSPDNGQTGIPEPGSHLRSGPSAPNLCATAPRDGAVHTVHAQVTKLPVNEHAESTEFDNPLEYAHSATFPETDSLDDIGITPGSDEDFYMLDIPELFTSPWVPVASHLYVPPGLGKLISGMREQLAMEARARRRAEELHQEELRRRISAEKVIEDLRTDLKKRQRDWSSLQKTA